jgi:hypothetical protein
MMMIQMMTTIILAMMIRYDYVNKSNGDDDEDYDVGDDDCNNVSFDN